MITTTDQMLRLGREILNAESQVLRDVAEELGKEFCGAVDLLYACQGNVIVCGMGKAGLVGQKIAATLASTSTRSHFLHPAEAFHGDLGRIHRDDIVLMLSHSGETEEVTRLLPSLRQIAAGIIAITGNRESSLARQADVTIYLGDFSEADPLGLAPSSSTTAMLAMGDALALVTAQMRGVSPEDFARFHPGGSLGRKLAKVDDVMQPLENCRVASDRLTVREVFVAVSRPGRRTGAVMLVNADRRLSGIITDSDLARLVEQRADEALDGPVHDVMTRSPATIACGAKFLQAVDTLASKRISELPVIDDDGKPLGLIDITDVVGFLPDDHPSHATSNGPPTLSIRAA